ncbi:MAG: response regulator [Desulfobulbaceae bacterium]|nr:response regulator [Desulfobulbaceae bacterium]
MHANLSKKILVPVLTTIALGLVAVLLITYFNARVVVQQELTRRLEREAQLTAKLIDNWLQARTTDMVTWSQQQVLSEALTEGGYYGRSAREGAKLLLTTLQQGYPYYDNVFLADLQGNIIALSAKDAPSHIHVRLADRSYFQETLQGKNVISPVIVSKFTNHQVFTITTPIKAGDTVVGVVGAAVDFAVFKSLFLDDFKLKRLGYAYITDGEQQVLASSRDNEQQLMAAGQNVIRQRIAANDSGMFTHKMENSEILTVYQHLQQTNWSFNLNQSLDETLRPLLRIGQISAAGTILILFLISLVISALFRRLIVTRLHVMLETIAVVKAGDFSPRIAQGSVVRPDEISELTHSFNTLIEQLDHILTELHQEIRVREEAESALAHHQENLEELIAVRSLELEQEISERRRVEARLARMEKMEMIGTLAGGVAHDLNNILSGVVTYPELLLMKIPADSPLVKPLLAIKQSGEKAAAIVQDLLTLARRGVTVKEPVNYNHIIEEYLHSPEYQQLQERYPGVEIVTEYADDLPNILGSPVHLAKTVMNLIGNAVESMVRGGRIRIKTENRCIDKPLKLYENIGEGEYVVLIVEDQGSGIETEDLNKIFEPFYTNKKMGRSGTGLGLAVVWGTVKDHDGYINCESKIGQGTKFTLFFPVTSRIRQQQRPTVPLAEYQGHGEKILVIDDSEEQREIASTILRDLDYQVTTVDSGAAGVALLRREKFDLLLLDMILGPGIDGLDTYRQILAHTPGQRAIIASGFSETERVDEALRLGARQYLKKPYTIATLGVAVRHGLDAN